MYTRGLLFRWSRTITIQLNGYKLCFSSRRLVLLFVRGRLHTGASQEKEEKKLAIDITQYIDDVLSLTNYNMVIVLASCLIELYSSPGLVKPRRKSKDWFTRNLNNVSKWKVMYTRGLLFRWSINHVKYQTDGHNVWLTTFLFCLVDVFSTDSRHTNGYKLCFSSRRLVPCSSPGLVKPKTKQLVFVASPLSTPH
jgi:hypothetical protein